MENRRLLLAALLSAVVLIAWNYMVMSLRPPEDLTTPPAEEFNSREELASEPAEPGSSTALLDESPALESGLASESDERLSSIEFDAEVVAAQSETRSVLENELFRAEFTNRGAQLVSFKLKKHTSPDGSPLEMVRPRGVDPYPFALVVEATKSHRLNNALFEVKEEIWEGLPSLRFRHRSERGSAEKLFRLRPDNLIDVEVTVLDTSDWGLVFGPGLRELGAGEKDSQFVQRMAAYRRSDGESDDYQPRKAREDIFLSGSRLSWVSLEDNFFLSAVIPRQGLGEVVFRPVVQRAEVAADAPRFLPAETELDEEGSSREFLMLLGSRGERLELLAYFGAKEYRHLSSLPYHLEETVRWGFFGFFARPLYYALEWIHTNMVANYGWAIVLVTILIRLLFFPLTYKSQDSMAKMQELNPKLQAIKNKYRGKLKDKQGPSQRRGPPSHAEGAERPLPPSGCQPRGELSSTLAPDAGLFRLFPSALDCRRAARRSLAWLDPGSFGGGSLLRPAAPDGSDQCRDAEDDACGRGSRAASSDPDDADHVYVLRLGFSQRPGALLGRQQPAEHASAVDVDQVEAT